MRRINKSFPLLLVIILAASSLIMVEPASAQSIPKPFIPKFMVYFVNHPYDVPATSPTYTTDPYTGEQKLVNPGSPGYHFDNFSIELWVQNEQPSYFDGVTTFRPYYNVRTKGDFEQSWTEVYPTFQGLHTDNYNDTGTFIPNGTPDQSSSVYTVISYSVTSPPYYTYPAVTYPPNATIDFQVSAIIGHDSQMFYDDHHLLPPPCSLDMKNPLSPLTCKATGAAHKQ